MNIYRTCGWLSRARKSGWLGMKRAGDTLDSATRRPDTYFTHTGTVGSETESAHRGNWSVSVEACGYTGHTCA